MLTGLTKGGGEVGKMLTWTDKGGRGYTMKYSMSPREIPRAKPKGFPKGSGYIKFYIPT